MFKDIREKYKLKHIRMTKKIEKKTENKIEEKSNEPPPKSQFRSPLETKREETLAKFEEIKQKVKGLQQQLHEFEDQERHLRTQLEIFENIEPMLDSELKEITEWQERNKTPSELQRDIEQKANTYESMTTTLKQMESRCTEKLDSIEKLINHFLE